MFPPTPRRQEIRSQASGTEKCAGRIPGYPGHAQAAEQIREAIRQSTIDALEEVDLIVFLCAIDDPVGAGDRYILSLLENRKAPVILVLSKIDLIPKEQLLLKIAQYSRLYDFADIVPISAKTGDNLTN